MAEYRVLIQEADAANDFEPGDFIGEFANAKYIGYASYLNDIGEAFWTINQDDLYATSALRGHFGTAHAKILRNGTVVWRGVLSELDATHDDVIMYAYGYESILYWLLSAWNQTFENVQIGGASDAVVNKLWSRAVSLGGSQLGWATTGTIEAPVTTSNGATPIELETYKVYFKRILFAFKELVAVAVSDTTNVCYFELDYSTSPTNEAITFNLWKDNSSDVTDPKLVHPGNIVGFSDRYVPILGRNDIKAVGTGARDQLFRVSKTTTLGTFGSDNFGLRQEPLYLSWVRDEAELQRVANLRGAKALREDVSLSVRMWPDSLLPWRASGGAYELGDRLTVDIDRGITQLNKLMFLEGEQVVVANGVEYVQPLFSDRAGS